MTFKLPNVELEGRNNVYLLGSDDGIVLVDTGMSTPEARNAFERELVASGLDVGDIDTILLTHWHPDHAGLTSEIQRESGASVYVHEADAPIITQDEDALEEVEALQRRRFEEWRLPEHIRTSIPTFREQMASMVGPPPTVTSVTAGDTVDLGDFDAEVVHTPGHTAGHCAFAFRDRGYRAFVGDSVLPTYTPNLGAADFRVDDPLTTYLETLSMIVDAGYDRLLPGHHEPIEDPGGRAREIAEHHRKRTETIYDIVQERDRVSAWGVATDLFGSLEKTHVLLGASEAHVHLSFLVDTGFVECVDGEYVARASGIEGTLDEFFWHATA